MKLKNLNNFLHLTSQLDMFRAPVKINLPSHRDMKSGQKSHSNKRGSFVGFILTVMSIMISFILFLSLIQKMYSY